MVVAKRLGVGAASASAAASSSSEHVSEDWTKTIKKQILSVGKKRRHDNFHGDDDDDDDVADNDDSSSSDEEEGRTTAVKERKQKTVRAKSPVETVVHDDVPTNDTKTIKKKKGKKERSREQQATQDDVASAREDATAAAPSSTASADKDEVINTSDRNKTNQKRKRPKVRSRQKNIAKDNRAANDKPSHLVPGRDDYAGRAMTQRTREKLGLGKSKSSVKSKKSVKLDDAFEKGEWVDGDGLKEEGKTALLEVAATSGSNDSNDATSFADNYTDVGESVEKHKESSLKKIGDCIIDYEPPSSTPAKKKKKDNKKKKYKNV